MKLLSIYNCIKKRFEELGIVQHEIPADCAFLTQQLDVGVCKPFKMRIHKQWWQWMLAEQPVTNVVRNTSREDGSCWVVQAWNKITSDVVVNAWKKLIFLFFELTY